MANLRRKPGLALACWSLLSLLACAPPPPTPQVAKVPALPPPGVARVLHVDDREGFLAADSGLVVVLTRAASPVERALELHDQLGRTIAGETRWLARQLVAFYPSKSLEHGLDLQLTLVAPLESTPTELLSPRAIDSFKTAPLTLTHMTPKAGATVAVMGALSFAFETHVPASDVQTLAMIRAGDEELPFTATDVGDQIVLRAAKGFPPGRPISLEWKSGPTAQTSAGRALLPRWVGHAGTGLSFNVGAQGEHCVSGTRSHYRCSAKVVTGVFSAPIDDDEIAIHTHPALTRHRTGDLRGHRFEITLDARKPTIITLDRGLRDHFHQELPYREQIEITYDP
jgi:hypothetical protein